jgi:integrase
MALPENIQTAPDGRYSCGDGLYLQISKGGKAKSWIFRYRSLKDGRHRDMGLGSYKKVTKTAAWKKAIQAHEWLDAGDDPITKKRKNREGVQKRAEMTVNAVIWKHYKPEQLDDMEPKTQSSYAVYLRIIDKAIGKDHVGDVEASDLADKILNPIIEADGQPSHVRSVLHGIFKIAKARGYCSSNPAAKDALDPLLLRKRHRRRSVRRKGVLRKDMPRFLTTLREYRDKVRDQNRSRIMPAYIAEFVALTGSRVSEVLDATWSEMRTGEQIWLVPWEHLKNGKGPDGHQTDLARPITTSMMKILEELKQRTNRQGDDDPIFPSDDHGGCYTYKSVLDLYDHIGWEYKIHTHGFRTTLIGWGDNSPHGKPHLIQIQVDHPPPNKVDWAYSAQSDEFKDRRVMMLHYDDKPTT